jgi:hypothetical protein
LRVTSEIIIYSVLLSETSFPKRNTNWNCSPHEKNSLKIIVLDTSSISLGGVVPEFYDVNIAIVMVSLLEIVAVIK